MPNLVESPYLSDLIVMEIDRSYSRTAETIAATSTTTVKLGTVMGRKTADGKLYPCAQAAADGTQNACCILIADTATNTTGVPGVVISKGAVVVPNFLVWDASFDTQPKKDTAIAALKALDIIVAAKPSM